MKDVEHPFSCACPIAATQPAPPSPRADTRSASEQWKEALEQKQVEFLSDLIEKGKLSDYHTLKTDIFASNPHHLPFLQLELKALDASPGLNYCLWT